VRRVRSLTELPLIAVVEDDEPFRRALESFLGAFAFRVRTFASGEEFLQSRELTIVACVLLDLSMAGISGLEVKQQLEARGFRIPTVFVTANIDDEVYLDMLAVGAIAILPKPVDHQRLLRLLQGVMGER
jgi:two-component system, LuxR family, response regulator FixJ